MKTFFLASILISTIANAQTFTFGQCKLLFQENFVSKRVYYAHPLSIYDKPDEAIDVAGLNALHMQVINPNDPRVEAEFQRTQDFEIFLRLAQFSDVVAVRAFPDGKLGLGVAKEAQRSLAAGKVVFEILSVTESQISIKSITHEEIESRQLSFQETVEYLDRLGVVEKIKYK